MKNINMISFFIFISVTSLYYVYTDGLPDPPKFDSPPPPPESNTTSAETLQKEILVPAPANCERKAKNGDILHMHYVGKLSTGQLIDSSYSQNPNKPLAFKLGARQIIRGWEQGAVGMCVGEKRKLTIPPSLHYGDQGSGDGIIPPKATLVFEIELMDITDDDGTFDKNLEQELKNQPKPATFENMDYNGDKLLHRDEIIKFMNTHMKEMGEAKIVETVDGVLKEFDLDKDGGLSIAENNKFLESKSLGGGPQAGGTKMDAPHDSEEHTFDTVDADNDDAMSVEELTNYLKQYYEKNSDKPGVKNFQSQIDEYVRQMFLQMDANKDGKITIQENQDAAEKNAELEKAHQKPPSESTGKMQEGSILGPDTGRNGLLQDEPYIDPKLMSGEDYEEVDADPEAAEAAKEEKPVAGDAEKVVDAVPDAAKEEKPVAAEPVQEKVEEAKAEETVAKEEL